MIHAPCEIEGCGIITLPLHHRYPQSKWNRRKYEQYYVSEVREYINLIDHPANKQHICSAHNSGHAGQGKGLVVWTEKEFCEAMSKALTFEYGIEIKIMPMGKYLQRLK